MKQTDKDTQKKNGFFAKLVKSFFILIVICMLCFVSYFAFIRISAKHQEATPIISESQNIIEVLKLDKVQSVEPEKNIQPKECLDVAYVDQLLLINAINNGLRTDVDISQMVSKLNSMDLSDQGLKALVAQLNSYNLSKIDSYYHLNQEFQSLYNKLIMSITSNDAAQGWFCKYFNKMIFVRKIGHRAIEGGGADGLLAQAKAALDNGDLQQTFDLTNSMPDMQKNIASEWLFKLHNLVQIQNTVNGMCDLVITPQYRSKFFMVCSND